MLRKLEDEYYYDMLEMLVTLKAEAHAEPVSEEDMLLIQERFEKFERDHRPKLTLVEPHIGSIIKHRRRALGMTTTDLGRAIGGYDGFDIAVIEGLKSPGLSTMEQTRIATVLGLSQSDLAE